MTDTIDRTLTAERHAAQLELALLIHPHAPNCLVHEEGNFLSVLDLTIAYQHSGY